MSVLSKEQFDAIREAAIMVSERGVKRIDGEGWSVYFVPSGDEHGTVRIDIKRGAV